MRVVGVKVLKDKLSEYLRAAAAGETILVTDRDRVIAEIVKPGAGRPETGKDARWEEMIRTGVVTPAKSPRSGPPPRLPGIMTFDELMKELDADRADS